MVSVLWFRRDLRLADNPALLAAADAAGAGGVLPLFVLDDALRAAERRPPAGVPLPLAAGARRRAGRPARGAARQAGERRAPRRPGGRRRVRARRRGLRPVRAGSGRAGGGRPAGRRRAGPDRLAVRGRARAGPQGRRQPVPGLHAVLPGLDRARLAAAGRLGRGAVSAGPAGCGGTGVPTDPRLPAGLRLPEPGERAGLQRWEDFRDSALRSYGDDRDRPDLPATSRLSVYLKYGQVHPRTLLAGVAGRSGAGAETFRRELAWREFYADVLWHQPRTARGVPRPPRTADCGSTPARARRRALRGLGGGADRLPDRRRRDAPAARARRGCTTGSG